MRRKAEFDIISTFYPEMKPARIHATVSHECTFHRDLRSVHLRNRKPDGAMKAETGNILCLAHRDARLQPIPLCAGGSSSQTPARSPLSPSSVTSRFGNVGSQTLVRYP